MTRVLIALVCWTLCAQSAQTVPNLTGDWVLIPLSDSPYDAGFAPLGRRVTIKQDGSTLTITGTGNFTDYQATYTYRLDGTARKETLKSADGKQMETQTVTARWVDQTVVIVTETSLAKRTQTLALDAAGNIVATSQRDRLTQRGGRMVVVTGSPATRAYRRVSKLITEAKVTKLRQFS